MPFTTSEDVGVNFLLLLPSFEVGGKGSVVWSSEL
jgi:hypothetical protein